MAYLKTLQPPLQLFSTKPSHHHSLTTTTMKSIKALVHTLIVAHLCRAFRALRRAKSILVQALKDHNFPFSHYLIIYPNASTKSKRIYNKKVFFGSFRLHYNWGSTSSSHVTPVPESVLRGGFDEVVEGLPGYLLWLEEKDREKSYKVSGGEDDVANEIDRLAEMFIADCHEKFQLEKQESMRRFQEMMARSM